MSTLGFLAVRRKEPVFVCPAEATPRETKRLSDIDNQVTLRRHEPTVMFFRGGLPADSDDRGRDPVAVIRRALGKALVPYYPLAGRLREVKGGELVVDCTGEGVLFVEADADVRLAELEAAGLRQPFPYMDQLLLDFDASVGMLNHPFLLVQVTRLHCGGFVLASRFSHIICDGTGFSQFMSAVAELARGLPSPTISPAWSRELLLRAPAATATMTTIQQPSLPSSTGSGYSNRAIRTFTFGPAEIAAIKLRLPPHLRESATTFEALTAALWRARTAALQLSPDDPVGFFFACNLRGIRDLGLPVGYYGNAIVGVPVLTTAGELLAGSLGDAVERIRKAKAAVTAESVRSMADPFNSRLRANLGTLGAFRVSDIRHAGFLRLDFGWGEPMYAGFANGPQYEVSFLGPVNNGVVGGGNAVDISIVLPPTPMDLFASEVDKLLIPTTPESAS